MKNLFVVAALLFSKHLLDPLSDARTALAFLLFSLLSGSVYLINDICDIEKDRAHPRKRLRPIPSGQLPLHAARAAAAVLIIISLGASLKLALPFFVCAVGYLLLNLAYSFWLKHLPFIDVLTLACCFLLRVEAGACAIAVPSSPWLLSCTFLLACFLGFGKRAHELANAGERAAAQRAVLSRYSLRHLRIMLWGLAVTTCLAYVLYTLAEQTQQFFGTRWMPATTPFVAFGVTRFLGLVQRQTTAESPTDEMLHDIPFVGNLVLFAIATTIIIYFR